MRSLPASLSIVALVATLSSPALAQSDRDRAHALFRQSRARYEAGDFDGAAELLERACDLYPDRNLLYNLARAYERGGRIEQAIVVYTRYLDQPGRIDDRDTVEQRVRELRGELARSREHEPGETQIETTLAPAASAGVDPVPWVVSGIGGAGSIAGLVLAAVAQGAHEGAVIEPVQERAVARQQEAYDLASAANVALLAGGAILLTGVVWGLVALVTSGPSRSTAASPFTLRF